MDSFATKDEQKQQLKKGKILWTDDMYARLVSAFNEFSKQQ
jgi:hypothetical protein